MKFSVELMGAEEAEKKLAAITSGYQAALDDALQIAGQPVEYALKAYPPEVPGSKYQRTGNYGDNVQTLVYMEGAAVVFEADQYAPYSEYLRGNLNGYPGAYMHVGRWRTLKNIVDTLVPAVIGKAQDIFDNFVRRIWGD